MALPAAVQETADRCREALRWTWDPEKYSHVQAAGVYRTRLAAKELQEVAAKGKIERHEGRHKGSVRVNAIPEAAKERRRLIEEPVEINAATKCDVKVKFAGIHERHMAVLEGPICADFDFSAYYDHFELGPQIRSLYVFEDMQENQWHMNVMTMGQRQSVEVAVATTDQILNFPSEATYREPYIDNVRFIGELEKVTSQAATFLWRAKAANIAVNDVDMTQCDTLEGARREAIKHIHTEGVWLGEIFNYEMKTVAISKKTREKIEVCWTRREQWTWRNYAAMMALLFYATQTVGLKLAPYFAALRAYSAASRMLTAHPELWNQKAWRLQNHAEEAVDQWRQAILSAPPRRITPESAPEYVMVTDASSWGWGSMVQTPDGNVQADSHAWSQTDREAGLDNRRSTQAEPEAIFRALCKCLPPSKAATIHVLTDNAAAVGAIARGYSLAFRLNAIINRISRTFPRLKVTASHTRGDANPVDGMSRGRQPTVDDWERFRVLATELRGNWEILDPQGPT